LVWGTSGNQIYLADDNERDWYRENALDFYIRDLKLVNDSIAVLWDGNKNNYLYSLSDHSSKLYFPETPLKTFLASPIKTIIISSGSQGCFHYVSNEVCYKRVNDSIFETTTTTAKNFKEKKPTIFKNKISASSLTKVLTEINSNPSAISTFKDFNITETDKKNFLTMVDNKLKSDETEYFERKKKVDKDFYYSIPAKLDTLNNTIVGTILNQEEGFSSTTSNWFKIEIINQNNETLNITRFFYENSLPWNLPWEFEYNGQHFNCYNVGFSRLVNSYIPEIYGQKGI